MAITKTSGPVPPFIWFMWSSVASACGHGVNCCAPSLLRWRDERRRRSAPRCAFGPPLPPAGNELPEEFLDAAAYVTLGTSNSNILLLVFVDSECFSVSDSVCVCFYELNLWRVFALFVLFSSWFPLLSIFVSSD